MNTTTRITEILKLIPRLNGIIKNLVEATGKGNEYLPEVENAENKYLDWYEKGIGQQPKTYFQRGAIPFYEQGNEMKRDFTGEAIAGNLGGSAHVYWLSPDQQKKRDKEGSLNYHILVTRSAMSWTAFYSIEEFNLWLEAYGCTLDKPLTPGNSANVVFPSSVMAFKPLTAVLRYGAPDHHFQIFKNVKDEDRQEIEGNIRRIVEQIAAKSALKDANLANW